MYFYLFYTLHKPFLVLDKHTLIYNILHTYDIFELSVFKI